MQNRNLGKIVNEAYLYNFTCLAFEERSCEVLGNGQFRNVADHVEIKLVWKSAGVSGQEELFQSTFRNGESRSCQPRWSGYVVWMRWLERAACICILSWTTLWPIPGKLLAKQTELWWSTCIKMISSLSVSLLGVRICCTQTSMF